MYRILYSSLSGAHMRTCPWLVALTPLRLFPLISHLHHSITKIDIIHLPDYIKSERTRKLQLSLFINTITHSVVTKDYCDTMQSYHHMP